MEQIIRQSLARDRAKFAEAPALYATRNAGAPGSAAARQRAARARQIYEGLRLEIEAFRHLPGAPGHMKVVTFGKPDLLTLGAMKLD